MDRPWLKPISEEPDAAQVAKEPGVDKEKPWLKPIATAESQPQPEVQKSLSQEELGKKMLTPYTNVDKDLGKKMLTPYGSETSKLTESAGAGSVDFKKVVGDSVKSNPAYPFAEEGLKVAGEAGIGFAQSIPNLYKRAVGGASAVGEGLSSLVTGGQHPIDDAAKEYYRARGHIVDIPVPWEPSATSKAIGGLIEGVGGAAAGAAAAAGTLSGGGSLPSSWDAAKDAYSKYQAEGPPPIAKELIGGLGDAAMLKGVGPVVAKGGKIAASKIAPPIVEVGKKMDNLWGTVRGYEKDAAFKEALDTSRQGVDVAGRTLNREIDRYDKLTQDASGKLEGMSTPTEAGITEIGQKVVELYEPAIEKAVIERSKTAGPLYDQAHISGELTEKQTGQRVDVAPVADILSDALNVSDGIPDFDPRLKSALKVILEDPNTARPPISANGAPRPPVPGKGVTHLSMVSRWMKEYAYSGEMINWSGEIKRTFLKAARALDGQIEAFEPLYKAANDMYQKMSIPIESRDAFLGKVLMDTEGGIKGKAYHVVTPGDVPALVFEDATRIAQLKEAVAGGKEAAPKAVAEASKKVDNLVIEYYSEKFRTSSGQIIADKLKEPGVSDTLKNIPGATKALEKLATDKMSLAEKIDAHSAKATDMRSLRETVDKLMSDADAQKQYGHEATELKKYEEVLSKLKNSGVISASDFSNIAKTIKNSTEMSVKCQKYRDILRWTMWSAPVAGGVGYLIRAGSHLLGGKK